MPWLKQLQSLGEIAGAVNPDSGWDAGKTIPARLREIEKTFTTDMSALENHASFIFSADMDARSCTAMCVDLFRRWHAEGSAPSLAALAVFAMKGFGLREDDPLVRPVLMAALLGEAPNTLAYHNNMHYRKVLFQMIGLIAVHMALAGEEKAQGLGRDHIALLITAACVHDLGHDGRANNAGGTYQRGREEKRSFNLAKPYIAAAGLREGELDDLNVMLLCTDVTPLDQGVNPASELKEAYLFHERGGEGGGNSPDLTDDLEILRKRADLALLAMLMHEADIATSAGLDYEVTAYETALYHQETTGNAAKPSHIVDFLNRICQNRFHTEAGKKLYAANMERIYAQALQAVEVGDEPLPRAEDSTFVSAPVLN